MDVKLYFIKNSIEAGDVRIQKIHTLEKLVDMLTKCIPVKKFEEALSFLKLLR